MWLRELGLNENVTNTSINNNKEIITKLLDNPPSSWKKVFNQEKINGNSIESVLKLLDITAGGNKSGEKESGLLNEEINSKIRDAAMKGVLLSYYYNYPSWRGIGLARGIQLATQDKIWETSKKRMKAFFTRNKRYEQLPGYNDDENPSNSYISYLLWSGVPGKEWVL